jgi:hypothetical protein
MARATAQPRRWEEEETWHGTGASEWLLHLWEATYRRESARRRRAVMYASVPESCRERRAWTNFGKLLCIVARPSELIDTNICCYAYENYFLVI